MSFKKTNLCFGNWKLNKSPLEAEAFFNDFKKQVDANDLEHFCIFPTPVLSQKTSESNINWGGQNCFYETKGAFTGETSASTLKEMGAKYCLVGHSERRQIFNETDQDLNKKVKTVLENEMTPVFCIGETDQERESNKTFDVLNQQLEIGLDGVDFSKIIIAYEPVWAIGTGKTATPELAAEVHDWLRERALSSPLLYGGSVKPANAADLYKNENINGFLIGGASLKVEDFVSIYKQTKKSEG